jgi:hypothetical protein
VSPDPILAELMINALKRREILRARNEVDRPGFEDHWAVGVSSFGGAAFNGNPNPCPATVIVDPARR